MSNSFFKFKKFTIFQDRCAMKVCTDACLFGAWVAGKFDKVEPETILDIGTGTGLLSLMLAQQLRANIQAIEIDDSAFIQATENITQSEFNGSIQTIHGDVRSYLFSNSFELIVSNPPFYEQDLRSPKTVTNMARHDETLTMDLLFTIASKNLAAGGSFAILIPYHRLIYCLKIAGFVDLYAHTIMNVRQSNTSGYFRSMVIFKKGLPVNVDEQDMIITINNEYSPEFNSLLKAYYLRL